jgi:hypothetical protein
LGQETDEELEIPPLAKPGETAKTNAPRPPLSKELPTNQKPRGFGELEKQDEANIMMQIA